MGIAPELPKHFLMTEDQRSIVSHEQGPLCVIAGPGSGKTRSMLHLVLNLLLRGKAQPSEVILCTYNEKAAAELRVRLLQFAQTIDYPKDLSALRIGTIHGMCQRLLMEHIHYAPVENGFTTLSQFTQRLLISDHINDMCSSTDQVFLYEYWRCRSVWDMAKQISTSFDIITEELLFEKLKERYRRTNPSQWQKEIDRSHAILTKAYHSYQKLLETYNCLDFSHLQKCVYNLLQDPEIFPQVTKGIRYILVDEYQDTSYLQEQILRMLASATSTHNLFVVGDEDQALYRFRGATVRNILTFEKTFPACQKQSLLQNYRSHQDIIAFYNAWMESIDWTNGQGETFRTAKQIIPQPSSANQKNHAVYRATFSDPYQEAEQFAILVETLKEQGKIGDYSEVALLLYSAKPRYSQLYIDALQQRNIPFYCPRATLTFLQEEIRLIIGCFAYILDYQVSRELSEDDGFSGTNLLDYLSECQKSMRRARATSIQVERLLFTMKQELLQERKEADADKQSLMDYFYRLITVMPLVAFLKERTDHPESIHLLEQFSRWLNIFQDHYHYDEITLENKEEVADTFFRKFISLLYTDNFISDEDDPQSMPKGRVPILTIHQAKGLEFLVVVVGRLDQPASCIEDQKQRALRAFSNHTLTEPASRVPSFDQRRLYYVAFSRAKQLLLLTASQQPGRPIASLWQTLPIWEMKHLHHIPTHQGEPPQSQQSSRYGFTTHIQTYNTCPRQYQYFYHHHLASDATGEAFSGQLVHYMLEYIHRLARDGKHAMLHEERLAETFERKSQLLARVYRASIDDQQKTSAWQQILWYVQQNQEELQHVSSVELPVELPIPLHQDPQIVTGRIDLLVNMKEKLALIDFKTVPAPARKPELLEKYKRQLYFYAYALEHTGHPRPKSLFLYWTTERTKQNALMEIPVEAGTFHQVEQYLQETLYNIKQEKFHVWNPPDTSVCQRCHLRYLCKQDKVIE